jgi:tetratricopeptide (TPR) repeat protein
MFQRLGDKEFPPPSDAQGLPRERRRLIRGDLDRVVLHALERDPEKRYPSVEQLLADLERYRAGYPVTARRASLLHRARKFVRRNTLPVAAVALAMTALLAGAGVAAWKARVARQEQEVADRRFRDLQSLAHSVIFDLHDSIRQLPGSVEARRLLVATALKYLDGLNAENIKEDSLQMELAGGYVRMAYVQGGIASINIGDTPGAQKSYRTALRILDQQWRRRPDDEQVGTLRFATAYNLALTLNDPLEAADLAGRYAQEANTWMARDANAAPMQAAYLLYLGQGRSFRNAGAWDRALAALDTAAEIERRMLPKASTDESPRPMFTVSVTRSQGLHDSGLTAYARTIVLLDMHRWQQALESAEQTRQFFETSLAQTPGQPPGAASLKMQASTHGVKSQALFGFGAFPQALQEANTEFEGARANYTDESSSTQKRDLAQAHRDVGNVLCAQRNFGSCLEHFREAVNLMQKVVEADPAFILNRSLLAAALNDLANGVLLVGQTPNESPSSAGPIFRRAIEIADKAIAEAPNWADLSRERMRAAAGIQTVEARLKKF